MQRYAMPYNTVQRNILQSHAKFISKHYDGHSLYKQDLSLMVHSTAQVYLFSPHLQER